MKRYRSVKLTTDAEEELNVSEEGEFTISEDADEISVNETVDVE